MLPIPVITLTISFSFWLINLSKYFCLLIYIKPSTIFCLLYYTRKTFICQCFLRIDIGVLYKNFNLLEHVFSLGGTDKLLALSDNSITQKIMKLLDIAKYNYKVMTEIPNDIQKLENEYGIKIKDQTRCSLETTIRWEANDKIRAAVEDDPILSDYTSFMRMTSKDGSSCTAHKKTSKI